MRAIVASGSWGSRLSTGLVAAALAILLWTGSWAPATPASLLSGLQKAPTDADTLAGWIRARQYTDPAAEESFGAIRIHHDPGHWAGQTPYYRVVPYTSSLAVYSYLRANANGSLELAEGWIGWYLGHMDASRAPPGVVLDHWYLSDGSGETTCPPGISPNYCPYEDASDSYAGTFLLAVGEYVKRGGERAKAFLDTPERRAGLEGAASVILALQDPVDGLTWARADYHVKYTMDNSEAHAGLRAAATIEEDVFGDAAMSDFYAQHADRIRQGIETDLYNPATGLYRLAKHENGAVDEANLLVWYPGTAPLVWPHLFGATDPASTRAQAQMKALNDAWDGIPMPDWTSRQVDPTGQLWPSIGHAALLSGDLDKARAHAAFVKCRKFPNGNGDGAFAWPWTVDDAGRLLSSIALGVGEIPRASFCP